MTRLTLMTCLFAAACARNQQEKDLYDNLERGSRWRLTLDAGTLSPTDVGGGRAAGAYAGPCPLLATKLADVPSGSVVGADAGCTASLAFDLIDYGDVEPLYDLTPEFEQTCSDNSRLSCSGDHFASGDSMTCWWTSGTVDPSVDGLAGDCTYPNNLTRVD